MHSTVKAARNYQDAMRAYTKATTRVAETAGKLAAILTADDPDPMRIGSPVQQIEAAMAMFEQAYDKIVNAFTELDNQRHGH